MLSPTLFSPKPQNHKSKPVGHQFGEAPRPFGRAEVLINLVYQVEGIGTSCAKVPLGFLWLGVQGGALQAPEGGFIYLLYYIYFFVVYYTLLYYTILYELYYSFIIYSILPKGLAFLGFER